MWPDGDEIANSVIETFNKLPAKAKPRTYDNGNREWVPLAGIVLHGYDRSTCVSLGTGMRCLPAYKVPAANGVCLHDWHAEIVAIRAFNLFLLKECERLARDGDFSSTLLRRREEQEMTPGTLQPFAVRDNVSITMYCSEMPCGDASMETLMGRQEDATPWQYEADASDSTSLDGRAHFSRLGRVRRKPARGDAASTLSKSCSDKLALKQCTSLLSSATSLLINPSGVYLDRLVVPADQFNSTSITRAFQPAGRLAPFKKADGSLQRWNGGYTFQPFTVSTTTADFGFSRQHAFPTLKPAGSNITAIWTTHCQEVLIGGTIQGNKQFSTRGASAICKARLWRLAFEVARTAACRMVIEALSSPSYSAFKVNGLLASRQRVKDDVRKEALRPWIRNNQGDGFAWSMKQ